MIPPKDDSPSALEPCVPMALIGAAARVAAMRDAAMRDAGHE
jgi:hypothetical protein